MKNNPKKDERKQKKKKPMIKGIILIGILVLVGIFFISKDSDKTPASPETEQMDPIRYFLSEVELLEKKHTPVIKKCFFGEQGSELYRQWSAIYYPPRVRPYEVSLVRVEFQNPKTSLDESCFIREIKTDEDWQEVRAKYDFSKERFGK